MRQSGGNAMMAAGVLMPRDGQRHMTGLAGAVLAALLGLGTVTACTSPGDVAGETPTSSVTSMTKYATITGSLLEVGGPVSADGSPPAGRPIAAIAAVYPRRPGQISIAGKVIAQTRTPADGDGSFSLKIPAGDYFIIAESPSGSPMTSPQPLTVTPGQHQTLELRASVP